MCAFFGQSTTSVLHETGVGSRGAVVSAALSERKVAGSIPTIGDIHTVAACKKAGFECLATDVKKDTFIRYKAFRSLIAEPKLHDKDTESI